MISRPRCLTMSIRAAVWSIVPAMFAMTAASQTAEADTIVATRPGVMCTSPDALARLTLPDGSSRSASPGARPEDLATKRQGGCIDIPLGAQLPVREARRQTSIVVFDPNDGRGARTFIVPNIDFNSVIGSRSSSPGCYRYGVPVRLSGIVTIGSARGEDPHPGKTGTTYWRQITLDHAICVDANPAAYEDAEQNVRAIQPAWLGEGPYPFATGKRVTVEGELYHQDNGNQMTVVLIQAKRVTVGR